MPRTTRSICTPAREAVVEQVDDLGIDQRVVLHPDRRRPAGLGMRDLLLDVLADALAQIDRRDRHLLELGRLGIAGDEVEDAADVAGDHRIGGEERQVGVDARGHRMIVAGADMDVGRQAPRPRGAPPCDSLAWVFSSMKPKTTCTPARSRSRAQRMLASSSKRAFSSTSAVTDLPASAASTSCLHDRRLRRGAVERLLDRDHVGIARRLLQELHHHVEQLVGMVDDQVLLPDRGEAVAAVIADALGEARIVGHELRDRAGRCRGAATARSAPARRRPGTPRRRRRASARCTKRRSSAGIAASISSRITEPRRRRLSAVSNSRTRSSASSSISTSESRMTRNAPWPFDRVAGEQPRDEQAGRLLERDHPRDAVVGALRQADEALDLLRHADQRVHRLAVARARELKRDGEAEIGNERERMRRIDRERRQHREDVLEEIVFEPAPSPAWSRPAHRPARCLLPASSARSSRQRSCWSLASARHRLADPRELLGRRQPVRAPGGDAVAHLALRPATRTMKNSSRLLAEIDRNRSRSRAADGLRWPPPPGRGG